MALKNEVVIGKSEVENSRKQLRLSFGRRRNWDPHSGCSLAKITYSHHCQSILWTSSEAQHTELQVLLWEPKLLFPVLITFASGQKQWSQEQYQLAILVFCPEPNSRGGTFYRDLTQGLGLIYRCLISSWDLLLVPTSLYQLFFPWLWLHSHWFQENSQGKVSSWEMRFCRPLKACKGLVNKGWN